MSGASANSATVPSSSPSRGTHHSSYDLGHKKGTSDMFSGMKEYKRAPENAAGEQRREALKDMSSSTTGRLGQIWNNTFRGADGAKKEGE